jgi:hypothetical protein
MLNLSLLTLPQDDDAATAPPEEPAPLAVALRGDPVSLADHAQAVAWLAWRNARRRFLDWIRHPGSIVHWALNARPETIQQVIDYRDSRRFVPPGHDGGPVEKAGVRFFNWVGLPWYAFFMAVASLGARPLRFCGLLFVLAALTVPLVIAFA